MPSKIMPKSLHQAAYENEVKALKNALEEQSREAFYFTHDPNLVCVVQPNHYIIYPIYQKTSKKIKGYQIRGLTEDHDHVNTLNSLIDQDKEPEICAELDRLKKEYMRDSRHEEPLFENKISDDALIRSLKNYVKNSSGKLCDDYSILSRSKTVTDGVKKPINMPLLGSSFEISDRDLESRRERSTDKASFRSPDALFIDSSFNVGDQKQKCFLHRTVMIMLLEKYENDPAVSCCIYKIDNGGESEKWCCGFNSAGDIECFKLEAEELNIKDWEVQAKLGYANNAVWLKNASESPFLDTANEMITSFFSLGLLFLIGGMEKNLILKPAAICSGSSLIAILALKGVNKVSKPLAEQPARFWPPLFFAAFNNSLEATKLLIDAGADTDYTVEGKNFIDMSSSDEFKTKIRRHIAARNQERIEKEKLETEVQHQEKEKKLEKKIKRYREQNLRLGEQKLKKRKQHKEELSRLKEKINELEEKNLKHTELAALLGQTIYGSHKEDSIEAKNPETEMPNADKSTPPSELQTNGRNLEQFGVFSLQNANQPSNQIGILEFSLALEVALGQIFFPEDMQVDTRNFFDLKPYDVPFDVGDCLFAAVADKIPGSTPQSIREQTVNYIRGNRELCDHIHSLAGSPKTMVRVGTEDKDKPYEDIVYKDLNEYLTLMKKPGTWATHLELVAFHDNSRIPIVISTPSNMRDQVINNYPDRDKPPIFLDYVGANHYKPLKVPDDKDPWEIFDEINKSINHTESPKLK